MISKHLIISGTVQGVGYRDWLIGTAKKIGLAGWVRNRRDGTVEAVLAGEADAVEEVTRACHRGPRLAVVTGITETFCDAPAGRAFVKKPSI
jgi:acylphosphatase